MAAKENSVKRYVVRLSADERERARSADPERKEPGTTAAESADIAEGRCEAGEGWSDSRIIKALETSVSMVYRVRKQLVEEGALRRC